MSNRKNILKKVWLTGVVSIVFSTVVLGFGTHYIDKNINQQKGILSRYENNRNVRFRINKVDYKLNRIKDRIERLTHMFAKVHHLDKKVIDATLWEYRKSRITSLEHLYISVTGESPSKEKISSWDEMSIEQLLEVERTMIDQHEVEQFMAALRNSKEKISKLEGKRSSVTFWTLLFQILGLVLINCAEYFKHDKEDNNGINADSKTSGL